LAALPVDVESLRRALEPFARLADLAEREYSETVGDEAMVPVLGWSGLKIGDLRRIRSIYYAIERIDRYGAPA
jgi:hypothetical protein